MSLTDKQSFYLSLIEQARADGKSLKQVATEHGVNPASLYNVAHILRRKGVAADNSCHSASGFVRMPVAATGDDGIELETWLANGQKVHMRVPLTHLSAVLGVLAS